MYTGNETVLESPVILKSTYKTTAILLNLSEPLFHKGCTLWMDNFYNSPGLAKFLK
jgi:hypothetical protein